MKTLKRSLFILIITSIFFSCNFEKIKVNQTYTNLNNSSNVTDSINRNQFIFFFNGGFNNERVKVFYNAEKIYDKIITHRIVVDDEIHFEKTEKNIIQFEINGKKSNVFNLDSRYHYAIIEYFDYKSEIECNYWNSSPGFD
jgi:hypothetical protein